MSELPAFERETEEILERFGFDRVLFEKLRSEVVAGRLSKVTNVVAGEVEPPLPSDVLRLPEEGSGERREAHEVGVAALRDGRVAQVVLAGGMATRFGGVVKAVVEVVDGRSFLELSLAETARLAAALDTEIPTAVMTSFATDAVVRAHAAGLAVQMPHVFSQSVSLRLDAGR